MNDEAFESVVHQVVGDNLITHFLVILEVMTEDGLDLRIASSDNLTAWTAVGMLEMASSLINSGPLEQELDEE